MIAVSDVPEVALECLQKDHVDVCNMINQLIVNLNGPADNQTITDELNKLIQHCVDHFFCEEKQMGAFNYPGLDAHKDEHDKFSREAALVEEEWAISKDKARLKEYMENSFVPWLVDHIKRFDVEGTQFIYDSGGR